MSPSGQSPTVDRARDDVLDWFTGKARQNAEQALDLLAQSEAAGEWLPGASRKVAATLDKSNVTAKLAKKYRRELEAIGDYQTPTNQRGWEVCFVLQYGKWQRAQTIDFDAVRAGAPTEEVAEVVETARAYALSFEPLVELVALLDATRPAPVVTTSGASPTVTRLLESLGLLAHVDTVRMPPIEWHTVERRDPAGKTYFAKVGVIKWPPGTVHGSSRYAAGSENNELCHACGHAIRNAYNWVPLVVDDDRGVPRSLWVGKDCAETLFGVRVRGDLELEGER